MATKLAADLKVGDIIFNRRLRSGAAGAIDRAVDGDALVVVAVAWPVEVEGVEEARGIVQTRRLGGGRGPNLRPRRWDQVEYTAGV